MDNNNKNKKYIKNNQSSVTKKSDVRWVLFMFFGSFFISIFLSYVSSQSLSGVGYIQAFLILAAFILCGVVFDIIGISAASANEKPFHSMAARKVPGALEAVWIVRNSEKVSSFCNDVVGDISGILSGATGAIIISTVISKTTVSNMAIQLIITGLIAAVTIGGKALGKTFALNQNIRVVFAVGKLLHFFNLLFNKGEKQK